MRLTSTRVTLALGLLLGLLALGNVLVLESSLPTPATAGNDFNPTGPFEHTSTDTTRTLAYPRGAVSENELTPVLQEFFISFNTPPGLANNYLTLALLNETVLTESAPCALTTPCLALVNENNQVTLTLTR